MAFSVANSADIGARYRLCIPGDGKINPEFFRCLPTIRRTFPFARELGRRLSNIGLGGRELSVDSQHDLIPPDRASGDFCHQSSGHLEAARRRIPL